MIYEFMANEGKTLETDKPETKRHVWFFFHSVNLSDIGLSYQFTYRFTFENEISERERERSTYKDR